MRTLARIVLIVLILAAVAYAGHYILTGDHGDGTVAAAIRQWFIWIWRGVADFLGRAFEPMTRWLARTLRRSATRQATRGIWRVGIAIVVASLVRFFAKRYGHREGKRMVYTPLHEVEKKRYRLVQALALPFKHAWNWKPGIPRWVRAMVALIVFAFVLILCIEVGHAYGETWKGYMGSLLFSVLMFWIWEKLPAIGFDALASISVERWKQFQAWRKRHAYVDAAIGIFSGEYLVKIVLRLILPKGELRTNKLTIA